MADFKVSLGADYSQLLTDMNAVRNKMSSFLNDESKKAIIEVHAKLDNKELNTALTQYQEKLKAVNKEIKERLFTINFKEGDPLNIDFRKPANDMKEIEKRASQLHKILYGLNQGIGTTSPNTQTAMRQLLEDYNQVINAHRTYSDMLGSSFINKTAWTRLDITSMYGMDAAGLKNQLELLRKSRNEYINYWTKTGVSQKEAIQLYDEEINRIREKIKYLAEEEKYLKNRKNLERQLIGAEKKGDLERQVKLHEKLAELENKRFGDTNVVKHLTDVEQHQQKILELNKKIQDQERLTKLSRQQNLTDMYSGMDLASLQRKLSELNKARALQQQDYKKTGANRMDEIRLIEQEIDDIKRLIDANKNYAQYNKKTASLTNQLGLAERTNNLEKQLQLTKQLLDLNLAYYGTTKNTKFQSNAERYQREYEAIQNTIKAQKEEEAQIKKLDALNEKRAELMRRINNINPSTNNREELKELANLYDKLAKNRQRGFEVSGNTALRDEADQARKTSKALRELTNEKLRTATVNRKINAISNLSSGIIADPKTTAELQTNIRLLQSIVSLMKDLQAAGRPQNMKGAMADLEKYKKALADIITANKEYESQIKRLDSLNEKRAELMRRINGINQNTANREELKELANLYDRLAKNRQKAFEISGNVMFRDDADQARRMGKALRELANEYVKTATLNRKEQAITNLKGGLIVNPKTKDELLLNIQLLERIRTYMKDLQAAGKPQNIQGVVADLEKYRNMLHDIRREEKQQNASFSQHRGVLRDIVNYAKMYVSIWQAARLARKIAETTAEFEKQKAALSAIIQDGAIALSLYNKLKSYSLETPLTFQELVSTAKKLTAYQIPVEDLFDTTKRLSDLAVGLGVDVQRIILAFGQIRASSVLRGQEIRQLTEAGIPILNKLAEAFEKVEGRAVSTAEVFKRVSQRGVPFEMVRDVLFDMTEEGGKFYQMQEKLMDTRMYGPMQKIKDLWTQALDEMGRSAGSGRMKGFFDFVQSAIKNWRVSLNMIAGLIGGKMLTGLMNIKTVIQNIKKAGWIGNLGNIFTAAGVAIGFLVGKIINANAQAKKFREEVESINTEYVKKANNLVESFKNLTRQLNESAEGSKAEEDALRRLQSAYSEFLPQQDLTIERLRDQKKGYDDLTDSILKNVEAQRRAAIEEATRNKYREGIKNILSKRFVYRNETGSVSEIPDKGGKFRGWLESYLINNIGNISLEDIISRALSVYSQENPNSAGNTNIINAISDYINKASSYYDGLHGELKDNEAFYKIADSSGDITKEMAHSILNIENELKETLAANPKSFNGDALSLANNRTRLKYYSDMLNAYGLKNDASSLMAAESLSGDDIIAFIRSLLYANGTNISGGNTDAFNAISSPYLKNLIEGIEKAAVEQFPSISITGQYVNEYIKGLLSSSNKYQEFSGYRFNEKTVLADYQKKVKDAYSAAKSGLEGLSSQNAEQVEEDQREQIEEYKMQMEVMEKLAEIVNVKLNDEKANSVNTANSSMESPQIAEQRKRFQNLKNAFNAFNTMRQWVSNGTAIDSLANIAGFDGIFEKGTETVDWEKAFRPIYNELLKYSKSAAESVQEEFNNMFPKEEAKVAISEIKRGIESIDRSFAKNKNAKEYFKAFLDAGMSWSDALTTAQRISGAIDVAMKSSAVLISHIRQLFENAGYKDFGNYDLSTDEGITKFESKLREETSEGEPVIAKETSDKILNLLEQLRGLLKEEVVISNRINDEKYDMSGLRTRRESQIGTFNEAIKQTGNPSLAIDAFAALTATNRRLMNPFNQGNDAYAALVATRRANNTDAYRSIAQTLPGGNRILKAFNSGDEKAIKKAEKRSVSLQKLSDISSLIDQISSSFGGVVDAADSVIEAFGGTVDKNDVVHTAFSSFSSILGSGTSAVQKALSGDFVGAVADGITAFAGILSICNKIHDAAIEEQITKISKHLDTLDDSLNNLNRTLGLEYGEEKWATESNILSTLYSKLRDQQATLNLENQKKNPDEDKQREYQNSIDDTQFSIEEKWKEIQETIFGGVDDISSRLTNALRDAFENGKNAARSWKDTVSNLMQDLLYERFQNDFLAAKVDEIIDKYGGDIRQSAEDKRQADVDAINEKYDKEMDKDKLGEEYDWIFQGNNEELMRRQRLRDKIEKERQAELDALNEKDYIGEASRYFIDNMENLEDDLNNIPNDPEFKAWEQIFDKFKPTASAASGNVLQSMTEDTARRIEALWNQALVKILSIDTNTYQVMVNTSSISERIAETNRLVSSFRDMMDVHQKNIYNGLSGAISGANPIYVKMN